MKKLKMNIILLSFIAMEQGFCGGREDIDNERWPNNSVAQSPAKRSTPKRTSPFQRMLVSANDTIAQLQRQLEEVRARASHTSQSLRAQIEALEARLAYGKECGQKKN